jgi:ferredoxin
VIEITVDGEIVAAEEGELLVDVLKRAGSPVPTLCHDERLEPYGGCRVCLVELAGAPRPVASCATRVQAGMEITTDGELRTSVVEMLLTEQLQPSPGGRRNELIELAGSLNASPPFAAEPRAPFDDGNALIGYDPTAASATRARSPAAARWR